MKVNIVMVKTVAKRRQISSVIRDFT